MSESNIILKGHSEFSDGKIDIYCSIWLGGCGTIFKSIPPKGWYDSDRDWHPSVIECPNCKGKFWCKTGRNSTDTCPLYITYNQVDRLGHIN